MRRAFAPLIAVLILLAGCGGGGGSDATPSPKEHAEKGKLVVALRADRMGEVSTYPDVSRLIERGLYLLGAMTADDLRAAIEGPARQAGSTGSTLRAPPPSATTWTGCGTPRSTASRRTSSGPRRRRTDDQHDHRRRQGTHAGLLS